MTKVFIGMPAYNGERFLEEAINSLRDQTFIDWKLFISDDASTDETRTICEEFAKKDSRITYFRQEKNIGMFPNFKFLIDKADCEYFMWAGQDDLWEKEFLNTCFNNLEEHKGAGFASVCTAEIDSLGRTLREIPEFAKLAGKPTIKTITNYILQPEILGKCNIMYSLFRTGIIRKVWSVYPQREEWGSDYQFSLAAVSRFEGIIDNKILFKKRQGGASNPSSIKSDTVGKIRNLGIGNPKNHMFPFGRFRQYSLGHMEALRGTPYRTLGVFLLLLRLPRSFFIYLKERNYKKFIKKTLLFKIYKIIFDYNSVWRPKVSYSQCGEDLIIEFLFNWLKIRKPVYLDIGANDPIKISNTYYFYKKGSRGVLIEPDPNLCIKLRAKRKKDVCLNIGIGPGNTETIANFYVMSADTLSTFSQKEAEKYTEYGNKKIKEVKKIKLLPINSVIENNFKRTPNLVSIDTEGKDLEILKSLDWGKYRPEVFCIETLTYTENNTESKIIDVIDFMKSKDYMIYADTYINTIFIDKKLWDNRIKGNTK
ncbi:MAG: FkbM family methyltransferase [Candidatus Roizmanbacteria bacterium]|nr:FkbM family methyltransferase [Candidatus Roizmanbacteria bacterium]